METEAKDILGGYNVETMIEQYNAMLIGKLNAYVSKLSVGIVDEDCTTSTLAVIIHCMENMVLFDDTQLKNILYMINQLNYA